jgi:peptidyl-prolyl cis-trans isomerase SurA
MMRRIICGLMGVGMLFSLAGAFFETVQAEICNRLVAIVNDDVITLHEIHKKIKELTGYDAIEIKEKSQIKYEKLRKEVLENLIDKRIANEKINELKIDVSKKEIDAAIQRMIRENQWGKNNFMAMLKARGLTQNEYRQVVKEDLQRFKLIDFEVKSKIIIRDEEIEEYYNEHKDKFYREKGIELATIFLLRNSINNPNKIENIEEKGEQILEALRKGSNFQEMVKKYSNGPGVEEGGYLGRFDPDLLEPEIRKIVQNTPEGKYSDLIIKPNGVQIIKVLSKSDGGIMPLEKARGAIYRILMREEVDRRYSAWIKDLRKNTYTKILF